MRNDKINLRKKAAMWFGVSKKRFFYLALLSDFSNGCKDVLIGIVDKIAQINVRIQTKSKYMIISTANSKTNSNNLREQKETASHQPYINHNIVIRQNTQTKSQKLKLKKEEDQN